MNEERTGKYLHQVGHIRGNNQVMVATVKLSK